ncbi:MAG: hypothetical protein B7Z15_17150 [Rhizobiales bacterium 32-66-8]|nr:MAG: hypothetical protein B7Z15_17150 [Rhizobiales bacterium 32-66-8]
MDVILAFLGPLDGRSILDVGCGGGMLARALAARGAQVTGVDPQPAALATARTRAPQARFEAAGAEALPFPDASFDAVVFLNSLHHVPEPLMAAALREAGRVSRGPVLVIEPLAEGPFFRAMQPVEDETAIRAAAQAALADALVQNFTLTRGGDYDDVRRFADVDAFLAMVVAVDPARATLAQQQRDVVAGLMAEVGTPTDGGVLLAQPHRAHLLARVEAS